MPPPGASRRHAPPARRPQPGPHPPAAAAVPTATLTPDSLQLAWHGVCVRRRRPPPALRPPLLAGTWPRAWRPPASSLWMTPTPPHWTRPARCLRLPAAPRAPPRFLPSRSTPTSGAALLPCCRRAAAASAAARRRSPLCATPASEPSLPLPPCIMLMPAWPGVEQAQRHHSRGGRLPGRCRPGGGRRAVRQRGGHQAGAEVGPAPPPPPAAGLPPPLPQGASLPPPMPAGPAAWCWLGQGTQCDPTWAPPHLGPPLPPPPPTPASQPLQCDAAPRGVLQVWRPQLHGVQRHAWRPHNRPQPHECHHRVSRRRNRHRAGRLPPGPGEAASRGGDGRRWPGAAGTGAGGMGAASKPVCACATRLARSGEAGRRRAGWRQWQAPVRRPVLPFPHALLPTQPQHRPPHAPTKHTPIAAATQPPPLRSSIITSTTRRAAPRRRWAAPAPPWAPAASSWAAASGR